MIFKHQIFKVAAALTCVFVIPTTSVAAAQESNDPHDALTECHATSEDTLHSQVPGGGTLQGTRINPSEQQVISKQLESGEIKHIAPAQNIRLEDAYKVPEGENGTIYRIPLESAVAGTDYILVTHDRQSVTRVAETHITPISDDSAQLQIWVDGEVEYDDVVHEEEPSGTQTRGVKDAWNTFNSCLNSAGVPMAVITGISIACGFLGAFTAGTAAPACMIVAAGGYAATVSFCYGRALKQL